MAVGWRVAITSGKCRAVCLPLKRGLGVYPQMLYSGDEALVINAIKRGWGIDILLKLIFAFCYVAGRNGKK